MQTSETMTKISAALLNAQKEMDNATKGAKNPFFKSSYADLNAIREAVIPPLNKNGISVWQPMVHKDGKSFIRTVFLHESGEFISSDTEIVTAKVNDPQAHGSGISYARRYGLQALASVGAEDDDGEKAMGRSASKAAQYAQTPADLPPAAKVTKSSFRKPSAKTAVVEELPDSDETEEGWVS
jgi:hypothetical protein